MNNENISPAKIAIANADFMPLNQQGIEVYWCYAAMEWKVRKINAPLDIEK